MAYGQPSVRLSRTCAAPPDAVYELLANLSSHLRWAGAQQSGDFRLLSLDAPEGRAAVGTTFTSTGAIPMSRKRWKDRSTVTVAEAPSTFEFVTEARVGGGPRAMQAQYVHRYQIEPAAGGSRVTYTFTQERIVNPVLRLGLPVMRDMSWRVMIPMFAGRGFRNLLADAEAASRGLVSAQGRGDSAGARA